MKFAQIKVGTKYVVTANGPERARVPSWIVIEKLENIKGRFVFAVPSDRLYPHVTDFANVKTEIPARDFIMTANEWAQFCITKA